MQLVNVNELPFLADDTNSVPENSTTGAYVGPCLMVEDSDHGDVLVYSVVWRSHANLFLVDAATGQLGVRDPVMGFEALSMYTMKVQVKDSGEGRLKAVGTVQIMVTDANEALRYVDTFRRAVEENSAVGKSLGDTLQFDDPEGDSLTARIVYTSTPGMTFVAIPMGSRVAKAVLDHGTHPTYTEGIEVSGGSLWTCADVVINVLSLNEGLSWQPVAFCGREVAVGHGGGLKAGGLGP